MSDPSRRKRAEPETEPEPEQEPEPEPEPELEPKAFEPVKRNQHAGVLVTEEEIEGAFQFSDVNQKGAVDYDEIKVGIGICE